MTRCTFLLCAILFALCGAPPCVWAKVDVSQKTASGIFSITYEERVWVDDAGTLENAGRASRCDYELASGLRKWPSEDPIGESGGLNLYGYVGNGPTGATDPLGLEIGNPNYAIALGILEWGIGGGTAVVSEKALESIGSSATLLSEGKSCMIDQVPSPAITSEEVGWSMLGYGTGEGLAKLVGPIIVRALGRAAAKGLTTPSKYFGSKTYSQVEQALTEKFGQPKGQGPFNKSFFNPRTKRTFNLHQDPSHRGGLPHIDIRQRDLPTNYYKDRPFYLLEK